MSLHGHKKTIKKCLNSERGSISVLTIGLFTVVLITSLILTDISSIYLAKRSLTLATEAAVQRGMKNLDKESYYKGEYNATSGVLTLLGEGEEDPGIPIDCSGGYKDAEEVLQHWQRDGAASIRENIESIYISDYSCDGFQIYLETKARARIPIVIPFIPIHEVSLTSISGAVGERADTNNYYGFDIG